MVNLTIDGKPISVEENTTIMEAAPSLDHDPQTVLSEGAQ